MQQMAVSDAACLGAALLATVGVGVFSELKAAAEAMVHWEPAVEPDAARVRRYRGLYRKWTKLFEKARRL